MTDALKPCPFCGGGADYSADMNEWPAVACDACGATVHGKGIYGACAAWSRRAKPVSVQEAARVLLDSDGYLSDCAIHAACYCAEIDETRAIVALREALRALAAPVDPGNGGA